MARRVDSPIVTAPPWRRASTRNAPRRASSDPAHLEPLRPGTSTDGLRPPDRRRPHSPRARVTSTAAVPGYKPVRTGTVAPARRRRCQLRRGGRRWSGRQPRRLGGALRPDRGPTATSLGEDHEDAGRSVVDVLAGARKLGTPRSQHVPGGQLELRRRRELVIPRPPLTRRVAAPGPRSTPRRTSSDRSADDGAPPGLTRRSRITPAPVPRPCRLRPRRPSFAPHSCCQSGLPALTPST